MDGRDECKFRLADVIHAAGKRFRYVYDFGDGSYFQKVWTMMQFRQRMKKPGPFGPGFFFLRVEDDDLGQVNSRVPFTGVATGIFDSWIFKVVESNETVLTFHRRLLFG